MKIVKPSFQIIEPTGYTIDDIYKSIELVGRVSHKSESSIKEGSAKTFVNRIINWGHNSCLEFGTVYLKIPKHNLCYLDTDYIKNKYSKTYRNTMDGCLYVSTSYRVLQENDLLGDLEYLCEPTEFHEKRVCVKLVCDRAIANEIVRHRKFSFLQESTRYCRYSSDKFDNELTFIMPCWIDDMEEKSYCTFSEYHHTKDDPAKLWFDVCMNSEDVYMDLLDKGWKPEQARNILPLSLKTELYMCGFISDYEQFFILRDDKQHVHPQAYELAHPLHEEFIKRGYIK